MNRRTFHRSLLGTAAAAVCPAPVLPAAPASIFAGIAVPAPGAMCRYGWFEKVVTDPEAFIREAQTFAERHKLKYIARLITERYDWGTGKMKPIPAPFVQVSFVQPPLRGGVPNFIVFDDRPPGENIIWRDVAPSP